VNKELDAQIASLLKGPLYEANSDERRVVLLDLLQKVLAHHYQNCKPYAKFCQKHGFERTTFNNIEDLPYLPASIFKDTLLLSIKPDEVFREIRSSATSSGRSSRIGLDKKNNRRWSYSLQRMLIERIGDNRCKTMILDDESALGRSNVVSARASMTRSLTFLASEVDTCLTSKNDVLKLDFEKLEKFLSGTKDGESVILFGFTFILYSHVILPLLKYGKRFNLPKIKIIHAGGWKKLESQKVTSEKLAEECFKCFAVPPENIIDIYGFSEQGGLLYPSCEHGFKHTPVWSEVICRDPLTLNPLPFGEAGLMQYVTPIQTSYPGHSIITEDMGYIAGRDDCLCGRKGTMFKIIGRSDVATEERGCGDIMADLFA